MDGEIIIVSVITTIGGLLGLYMMQYNWTLRQKIKYGYQMKRAKLSKKLKEPVKDEPTLTNSLGQLAPLLKNLDSDQLGELIDRFTGDDYDREPIEGGIADGLLQYASEHPEIVQNLLGGIKKNEPKEKEFSGQV
jgi:hypothetical protein